MDKTIEHEKAQWVKAASKAIVSLRNNPKEEERMRKLLCDSDTALNTINLITTCTLCEYTTKGLYGTINVASLVLSAWRSDFPRAREAKARGSLWGKGLVMSSMKNYECKTCGHHITRHVPECIWGKCECKEFIAQLTVREIEFIQVLPKVIVKSSKLKEIANLLGIAPKTVSAHITNISKKLEISGMAGICLAGLKLGIIKLEDIELPRRGEK